MSGRSLTNHEEAAAVQARTKGRDARFSVSQGSRKPIINPFPPNSFHAYCWNSGYGQDGRTVVELHRDWRETQV